MHVKAVLTSYLPITHFKPWAGAGGGRNRDALQEAEVGCFHFHPPLTQSLSLHFAKLKQHCCVIVSFTFLFT